MSDFAPGALADNPTVVAGRKHFIDDLRKAGVPEE
jgi:hypothetical protein